MVKRCALVIAPIEYKPLPGMEADADSYPSYFRSDYGGAWESSEIEVLRYPYRARIFDWLKAAKSKDYSIITFSGHGDYVEQGQWLRGTTRLWLDANQYITTDELFSECPRQVLIIDSCRTVTRLAEAGFELRNSLAKSFGISPLFRDRCRLLYDREIQQCEQGRIEMYGCSRNQEAGEDRDGGYFTKALLKESVVWANSQRFVNASYNASTTPPVLNCAEAFGRALTRVPPPQKPEIVIGRRQRIFPFAVSPRE